MWRSLVALVMLTSVAWADETVDEPVYHCKNATADVEVTFKPETELKDLLTWAMGFTCKNFVLTPSVVHLDKKVMLAVPNRLSPAQAYQTFLVALATMGLTVVPKDGVLRVVEGATARHETVPIYHKDLPPTAEQVVRFVYRVEHVQPETMTTAFTSLKSDAGDIQVLGANLVITDYASHVRDMLSLARLIDVAGAGEGIYTIPVAHASAATLSTQLATMLPKGELKTLVDERTNTLVVSGSERGYLRAKALADRLDIPLASEAGTTFHVYPVKSAIAEELAKTITDSIAQQQQQKKADPAAAATAGAAQASIEGQVKVMADKQSNKLIVMSTAHDYLAIKDVLRQLDEPRRQVYIEVTILEIQLGDELDLGASAHGGLPTSNGQSLLLGGVQTPQLKSTDLTTLAAATGLIGGLIGPTTSATSTILGTSIPNYGILIQAMANRSTTRIRQAPSLTVLDNETVSFDVGVNVPIQKGVIPTTTATSFSSVSTNIERQPLDFKVEIKPHISLNDTVLLEIKHSSQDLGAPDPKLGEPTWETRTIETRLAVHDQNTVFLGGIMQDRVATSENKVPLLGDIPILGHLFKYTTRSRKKSNLMIMLTPYIVKDDLDLQEIEQRKVREHDEFVSSMKSLEHMPFEPAMDYRRKRGLVEEISRSLETVDEDAATLREAAAPVRVQGGEL